MVRSQYSAYARFASGRRKCPTIQQETTGCTASSTPTRTATRSSPCLPGWFRMSLPSSTDEAFNRIRYGISFCATSPSMQLHGCTNNYQTARWICSIQWLVTTPSCANAPDGVRSMKAKYALMRLALIAGGFMIGQQHWRSSCSRKPRPTFDTVCSTLRRCESLESKCYFNPDLQQSAVARPRRSLQRQQHHSSAALQRASHKPARST